MTYSRTYLLSVFTFMTALCGLMLPALGQNLVVNGDFEQPNIAPAIVVVHLVGTTLDGWKVETGSVDTVRNWQNASGAQSLDLSGDEPGSIYQDLSTVAGQRYLLRFAHAPNPVIVGSTSPWIKQAEVYWDSLRVDALTRDQTGYNDNFMGWEYQTYNLLALSSTTRLRFVSLSPGNGGIVLDNISVSVLAVPEPNGILCLLSCICAGATVLRRRHCR